MAARLNDTPLMGMDGTKGTAAKTAPAAYDAELHFFQCRNSAFFVVHRMPLPRIRKIVNGIHFFFRQRHSSRILYYI